MKVYIMTDMEGVSGLADPSMCEQDASEACFEGRRLLAGDVNAAIEGALRGGAKDIVVCDGHGGGGNLRAEDIISPAKLTKPNGFANYLNGVDATFDACFLVGAHAMAGTAGAFMPHTQSARDWKEYAVNGRPLGEIGQLAILAGDYDVPVALVTGDSFAVKEARDLLGEEVAAVSVKHTAASGRVQCLALDVARKLIVDAARGALGKLKNMKPYKLSLPATVTLKFYSPDVARRWVETTGTTLRDAVTMTFTADTAEKTVSRLGASR